MTKSPVIYLDYAAATPLDGTVLAAMLPYFTERFHNPSAQYLAAKDVHAAQEAARGRVARVLGAKPAEIVFTAGGTEANNLAVHGIMRQYPEGNIVVSAVEHESVINAAKHYSTRIIPVGKDGRIDLDTLEKAIDGQTVMVSVMYANNEVGTIQPLKEASQIINRKRMERAAGLGGNQALGKTKQKPVSQTPFPLYFHTDACQAANYLPLQVTRLGVDLLTLNGGKMYGPKQSGALYVKGGTFINPLIDGGGQELGLRSGTENVPAIIGFAAALDLAQSRRAAEGKRLQAIQAASFKQIANDLPAAQVNGSQRHRLPNNINISIPGVDAERLVMELDERGIQVATGSACSAAKDSLSHVLVAIGLPEALCRATLRLTMGRGTTPQDMQRVIQEIKRLAVK